MTNRTADANTTMTAEQFIEGAKAAILRLRAAFDEFDATVDRLLAERPEPPLFTLHGNFDEPGGRPDTIETWLRHELLSATEKDRRDLPSLDLRIDGSRCDLSEENLRIEFEIETAKERGALAEYYANVAKAKASAA
jgi:hypothetical protein